MHRITSKKIHQRLANLFIGWITKQVSRFINVTILLELVQETAVCLSSGAQYIVKCSEILPPYLLCQIRKSLFVCLDPSLKLIKLAFFHLEVAQIQHRISPPMSND